MGSHWVSLLNVEHRANFQFSGHSTIENVAVPKIVSIKSMSFSYLINTHLMSPLGPNSWIERTGR